MPFRGRVTGWCSSRGTKKILGGSSIHLEPLGGGPQKTSHNSGNSRFTDSAGVSDTAPAMSGFNFSGLSETDFERFTFDLVAELGFVNVSWRKGTAYDNSPADSGRDIVCQQLREDIDKTKCFETWFLECKHCKKGISPSQLQNLLTWAQAERPHTAVIVASGFLSNPAKDYLENYRRNQKPAFRIKYWEHPDLQRLAAKKPLLIQKYGLVPAQTRPIEEILQQKQEFDRMQATYAKKGIPSNGCKMRMLTAKRLTLGWVLGENRDIPAD